MKLRGLYNVYLFDGCMMELMESFVSYKDAVEYIKLNLSEFAGEFLVEPEDYTGLDLYKWQAKHKHEFKCNS